MESKWFYIAVIVIISIYNIERITKAIEPLLDKNCLVVQEVKTEGVKE